MRVAVTVDTHVAVGDGTVVHALAGLDVCSRHTSMSGGNSNNKQTCFGWGLKILSTFQKTADVAFDLLMLL
jgi:hypothetical protein